MNFLAKLTQAIALMPIIVSGVESIFRGQPGASKKDKALDLFNLATGVTEAIAQKDIVDQAEFTAAATDLNNAVVRLLNASLWHKSKTQPNS